MNDLIWYLGWVAVACVALYLINRQRKSLKTDEIVNQEPTVMDLTDFRESMKVKSPLTEEDREWLNKMKDSAGTYAPKSENIWKDMIEVGARLKKLDDIDLKFCDPIPEHFQPFYPLETDIDNSLPRYYVGPIRTAPDWTEFKERNPELFQVTLAGSVLNGILFHEENDAVIHYTLEGNIPPNGDYILTGTLNGKTLNVTSFKSVEII